MNLVADESIDRAIVERLRKEGYTVLSVAEMEPSIPDEVVLEMANKQVAPLLTADKDFGELVFRQRRVSEGVILVRLAGLSSETKATAVAAVMREHASELSRAFTVVSPGLVRIRRRI